MEYHAKVLRYLGAGHIVAAPAQIVVYCETHWQTAQIMQLTFIL